MPRPTGSPVTVTITNGQPMREVVRFTADVTYDATGVPAFVFTAHTAVRLRDAGGNIVQDDKAYKQLVTLNDAAIPANVRASFTSILNRLDTLADPS